ncbi:MAG: alpha/beta fold hydrolase [Acidimicrobiales bacterium]
MGHSFGGYTAIMTATDRVGNDRVDAIVSLAPVTTLIDDADLASVDVPTLLVGASEDTTTPVADNLPRPLATIPGRPLARVDLVLAGHQSFNDVCDYREALESLGTVPAFFFDLLEGFEASACVPELLDIDEAHRLIQLFTTTFFAEHLRGDEVPDVLSEDFDEAESDVEIETAA